MTTSELMEAMAKAGAPFEAILIAIRALEAKDAEIAAREEEAAAKRAKQAARKKEKRGKSGECPQNVRGQSTDTDGDIPVQEADPSLSLSPNENNSNPHTHTHPDNIPAHEGDADPVEGLGEFELAPSPAFTPDDLWRMWNRAADEMGLPKVREMTEARRKRALTMIRKYGREGFVEAISAIERSTFLRGQTEQQFKADLDFLLQQKSFTRLTEGFYDRSNRAKSRSRFEPDGAMAYLQGQLGIAGDPQPSGQTERWDDGPASRGYLLPHSGD